MASINSPIKGLLIVVGAAAAVAAIALCSIVEAQQTTTTPRFASLRASEVNLRKGPGTDYPIAWVFRRAGLPVKIVREFESWREVVDAEGTTGWILRNLLSSRRTAQVLPWEVKPDQPRQQVPLRVLPRSGSRPVALVEAGVIADVHQCDGSWCHVVVGDFKGYIPQEMLWGVGKDEVVN